MSVSWSPRNTEVTELLAAYKDQREDLEQLEKEDIPMRVSLSDSSHSPMQKWSKVYVQMSIWTHICPYMDRPFWCFMLIIDLLVRIVGSNNQTHECAMAAALVKRDCETSCWNIWPLSGVKRQDPWRISKAQLCNQSIFQYVRDIQMKAEVSISRDLELNHWEPKVIS